MIADNSAASIVAFVRANVKRGATLLTDGHASFRGRGTLELSGVFGGRPSLASSSRPEP